MKRLHVLHVALPVIAGGWLYVQFRATDHLLFSWLDRLGLSPAVAWLRAATRGLAPTSEWLLYSLPDGLWLYAFAFTLAYTWREPGTEARCWRALPLALGLGSELAQGLGLLEGTFDVADALTYVAAFVLAGLAVRHHAVVSTRPA